MIEPLVVEFEVRGSPARAFALWTERTALWWPADHTISGDTEDIVFEPFAGGRIFERSGADCHDWGRVQVWDPPGSLGFSWHLFFTPEEATDVAITFSAIEAGTRIRITQTGWDRLGQAGPPRRERTGSVWTGLLSRLGAAIDALDGTGNEPPG